HTVRAYGHQLAHRGADPVRARLAALGENADLRPVGVAARVASSELDTVGVDTVEHEHDLDVREAEQALDCLRADHREGEIDRSVHAVPVVVDRFRAVVVNHADRGHLETHGRQSCARSDPTRQTLPRAQPAETERVSWLSSAAAHWSHSQLRATSAQAISSSSSISAMATRASRSAWISLASTSDTNRMSRSRSSIVSRRTGLLATLRTSSNTSTYCRCETSS